MPDAGVVAPSQREADLDALCADGWALFEEFDRRVRDKAFHPFVAADYEVVRSALRGIPSSGRRFLEWGSATGVITVMADLLGFDAVGIELDASLVHTARSLASRYQSKARFVNGSFLPTGFRWKRAEDRAVSWTVNEGSSAYVQMGVALDEFDVVFGYPWSGETQMMLDLMQQYGRRDALLLLHDTETGVHRYRNGREVAASD
jgi:hypothetical protein